LTERLGLAGYRVASDADFDPSKPFLEEMARCVRESRFTLAIISPRYLASGNCLEEATMAKVLGMREGGHRLVPVVIESTPGMPMWLADLTGVDFGQVRSWKERIEKLVPLLGSPRRGGVSTDCC